jgi:glycerol kinase
MADFLLVIDQGTTSTRALLFDRGFKVVALARREFLQSFPHPGWVEHDPETIWQDVLSTCREVIKMAQVSAAQIAGIGITNQRETTIIWDKQTGDPIYPAIVWQDGRGAEYCQRLQQQAEASTIWEKTGLLLDPYFSASKIVWILNEVQGARARAQQGQLLFGTIDSFLLWRLTGGVHATDISNAARTLLFNIRTQTWDPQLLNLFDIPESLLPKVLDNNAQFGVTDKKHLGAAIPIVAMIGDQQSAAFGQACFAKNMIKSTYGTGCFVLMNTGDHIIHSQHRLLSTIAYRIDNKITYALEGSIFIAGAAVQWLRDKLHLINNAKETEKIAAQLESTDGVYLVPAFTGLGAPYWDPMARGAILGLTRDSGVAHIVRAALESVCYQTRDLLEALQKDSSSQIKSLRVDGGMVDNDWLMQFLADILQMPIERSAFIETTALGSAFMAALSLKWLHSLDEIALHWQCEKIFMPRMSAERSQALYDGWLEAVSRVSMKKRTFS